MSTYDAILGHQRPIEQLEQARKTGRVAHAYLFHGPEGVGKQKVALAFAQALNCTATEGAPCGKCEPCRKINELKHPDVRLLACEAFLVERGLAEAGKGAPSLQIKNAQLDELASLFRHRPYVGAWKVVVTVDAERMNVNSQNRFLKTLEEPSANTLIILVTAHPDALLPTIRSRCQALAFGPLGREAVADYLIQHRDQDPEIARVLAAVAQGSLGLALQLADENYIQTRDEALSQLAQARLGDLADLLSVAAQLGPSRAGRERLEGLLDLMEVWYRDLLLVRLGVDSGLLVNHDLDESLSQQAVQASPQRLIHWIERVRAVRRALPGNVNPQMAMEAMLLDMKDAGSWKARRTIGSR